MEGGPVPPPETQTSAEGLRSQIEVVPWVDQVVEAHGFGPRSMYVEMCWLPVLGPTATLLYRRLGSWVEHHPEGLEVDLVDLSVSLGLGEGLGRNSLLARALGRLGRFEVASGRGDQLAVRQALPPLPLRHQRRLSYTAMRLHEAFVRQAERQPGELVK